MKGKLELAGMAFHAYHGCLEEEKLYGNRFLVDFSGVYDISKAAASDNLCDAQDVKAIYDVIATQMAQPSELIESLAVRIYKALTEAFPDFESIRVTVSKSHPSLGGQAEYSRITVGED